MRDVPKAKMDLGKGASSHDRSENNLFTQKNISFPFQRKQAELFNHTYSDRPSDHRIQDGTHKYSHPESVGGISKQNANEITISDTEKISPQEIKKTSRNIGDIQQELAGEEREYLRTLSTDAKTLDETEQTVEKLVSKDVESLGRERTTSGKIELNTHLADLRDTKESIGSVLEKLNNSKVQKKEFYTKIRSEIKDLDDSDEKTKLVQKSRTQDDFWQAAYTSSITRAEAQIKKIEAATESTQIALDKLVGNVESLEVEGTNWASEHLDPLIKKIQAVIDERLIDRELAKGKQTLEESVTAIKAAAATFRERDQAVSKLVENVESLKVEGTNWADEHLDSLNEKMGKLNGYLKELEKEKINIEGELKDTHDINDRAKAHYDKLRLGIERLNNTDMRGPFLKAVSQQKELWQEFNEILLVEHAELQIQKIDKAIDSIYDKIKIITENSALNRTTTEIQEPRSIKDIWQEEENQAWLNEYRAFAQALVEKWDRDVGELVSQKIEGTNLYSIEGHITMLRNTQENLNREIEIASNDKSNSIKHYEGLRLKINNLGDNTENAETILNTVDAIENIDNAYKEIHDDIIENTQLLIQRIDMAIEERQRALNKITKELRIANIQRSLEGEQARLNDHRTAVHSVLEYGDQDLDKLVNQKFDGTDQESIKEHITNLKVRKEFLNNKIEALYSIESNVISNTIKSYEELRLEINNLGNTTEKAVFMQKIIKQVKDYKGIYYDQIGNAQAQTRKIDMAVVAYTKMLNSPRL